MVRLKEYEVDIFAVNTAKFQFLNGAIKRKRGNKFKIVHRNFNSSMVRLKGNIKVVLYRLLIYFNSSMVRLKETNSLKAFKLQCHFNSSMVRLKGILMGRLSRNSKISIPQWCD